MGVMAASTFNCGLDKAVGEIIPAIEENIGPLTGSGCANGRDAITASSGCVQPPDSIAINKGSLRIVIVGTVPTFSSSARC